MNITVFQSLTLLAQKYQNTEIYPIIKSLYLSGIQTLDDVLILSQLLDDDLVRDYKHITARDGINNDPVRRYFESHLCHETLAESLNALDYDLLHYYYLEVLNLIKANGLWIKYKQFQRSPESEYDAFYHIRMENTEGLRILKCPDSYQTLKPKNMVENDADLVLTKRKKKLFFLANISYASWYLNMMVSHLLPLDIYHPDDGHYNTIDRGRKYRPDQDVRSQTLGIMRSYMALPLDDALLSKQPARYVRPADRSTFVPGAKQPEQGFKSLVSPFSNSISGTMLVQLKVMAKLMSTGDFVYHENEAQLKLYFKTYISYMIYHSGGHTLDEYIRVLQLPEIKAAFKNVPGFEGLTLNKLFQDDNEVAFETTVSKTMLYGQHILNMKQVSMEIPLAVCAREINKQNKLSFFHTQDNSFSKTGMNVTTPHSISPTTVTFDFVAP